MEYFDTPTIDRIAGALDKEGGRMRSLIYMIVESPAFQQRRGDGNRLAANGN
jgi:hypothetical protein